MSCIVEVNISKRIRKFLISRIASFFFFKELLYLFIYLFIYLLIYLFIYFWLCWVFVSVRGLSLVAASGGHSSSRCAGLSLSRPLLLWSTGSRCAGSVVVAHGPSCSAACGIFPDQGSNPCPLHWQADSAPPGNSPKLLLFEKSKMVFWNMFGLHYRQRIILNVSKELLKFSDESTSGGTAVICLFYWDCLRK